MKTIFFSLLIASSLFLPKQDDLCKYDSILVFTEDEKITFKQTTKLSYYNQGSRFAIRRDYHKIDLIFSSIYGLERKHFESYSDRAKLQSNIDKKDYIIRLEFKLPEGKKLEVKKYRIGENATDSLACTVRLYHLDKTKKGMKIVRRKYSVTKGFIDIEKIKSSSFCGTMNLEVPSYYNLNSEFSVDVVTKD